MRTTRTVVSIDDDSDVPVTGTVTGWQDDEICLVQWDGTDVATPVPADELLPVNRPEPARHTDVDTYVSKDLHGIAAGDRDLLDELRRLRFLRDWADNEMRVLVALGRYFTHPRPYTLRSLADAAGASVSGIRTYTHPGHVDYIRHVLGPDAITTWKDTHPS